MAASRSMLFARLQLAAPDARSVLVAPARSSVNVGEIAQDLASQAAEAGEKIRVVDLGAAPPAEVASAERLREWLASTSALIVVVGGGLLESPSTALACAAVDVIVLVVRRGRTSRADLEEARRDVERAGGKLAGAVLLE